MLPPAERRFSGGNATATFPESVAVGLFRLNFEVSSGYCLGNEAGATMQLFIPDRIIRWFGPAVVIAIGLIAIFNIPISRDLLCEPEKNCLIAWVGALSGWAALAGALLTVLVMREQLAEQKRQTDYITGDLDPEYFFDSSLREDRGEFFSAAKISVINRNRRTLILQRFEASLPEGLSIGVRTTKVNDEEFEWPISKSSPFPFIHSVVPGKEDGARASRCVIDCHVFCGRELVTLSRDADHWSEQPVTIKVFGFFKGAVDTPFDLIVSGTVTISQ